jgi:hypothetical protein
MRDGNTVDGFAVQLPRVFGDIFLVSHRRSGVCCKPFVSASSCRTPTFRKAILIQLVIENLGGGHMRHVDLPLSIAAFPQQPIGGQNVWRVSGAMV